MECKIFKSEKSDLRLDQHLSELTDRSRSYCSNLIKDGFVKINGVLCRKPSFKVKKGDLIEVIFPPEKKIELIPAKIPLNIIFENNHYIVINKQPGLCVHPAPGNENETLVNALLSRYSLEDDDKLRPGIVHRLDKDTSGLIIVTKHREAKEKLAKLFSERQVIKKYYAICYGYPKWDNKIVEAPIGRHPIDRKKMAIVENGRYAKTEIDVIKRCENFFLADIKLFTGRTHQIRVHLSFIGYPLIGDTVYGNKLSKKVKFNRQALHSYFLSFVCPFENKRLDFEIDLPQDMRDFLERVCS